MISWNTVFKYRLNRDILTMISYILTEIINILKNNSKDRIKRLISNLRQLKKSRKIDINILFIYVYY